MSPNRLLEISESAACFFRLLTSSKLYSYSELASDIGLTRNVLYYFSSGTEEDGAQATNVKLGAFSKIVEWLERTNLEEMCKTDHQRKLARELQNQVISNINPSSIAPGQFQSLTNGFTLADHELDGVLAALPNILIGIRQRGTTKDFQISIHRFTKSKTGDAIQWEMTFLQGTDPFNGDEIPRHEQEGVLVSGYAIPMGNTLTCIGRLQNQLNVDHNLTMMNLIVHEPQEITRGRRLYQGSLYGYSRDEAISRHMIFISTNHPSDHSSMVLGGRMGDIPIKTLEIVYPEVVPLFEDGVLGFSVGIDGKKVNTFDEAREKSRV